MSSSQRLMRKIKSLCVVTTGAATFFAGINIAKGNEKFYNNFLMPVTQHLNPEMSHNLAVFACKYKIFPTESYEDPKSLQTKFFGHTLLNPIGIAAGFDKNGEAVEGLEKIGFGFVEIGSVTPLPQPGNPKPRVFRLVEDQAVINRYGFNSDGHAEVYKRLYELKKDSNFNGVLGINLGKNKTSNNTLSDYVSGVELFGPIADYLVINISSPNTPGLRDLQGKKDLQKLLTSVIKTRDILPLDKKIPIFLKLAPDLNEQDIKDVCSVIKQKECKIDGLIISNTTIDRTNLKAIKFSNEVGGLSGAPLKSKSTKLIAQIYYQTNGKIPIIGVGGIFTGADAYEKIQAGASLVQLYTAFALNGPPIVTKIKKELSELLVKDGYESVCDAVGKNYKKYL